MVAGRLAQNVIRSYKMIELFKIILTASFTLIGGVFLFILNNIFVIPIQELRKLIGEIGYHVFLSRSLVEDIRIEDDISKDKLVSERKPGFL